MGGLSHMCLPPNSLMCCTLISTRSFNRMTWVGLGQRSSRAAAGIGLAAFLFQGVNVVRAYNL